MQKTGLAARRIPALPRRTPPRGADPRHPRRLRGWAVASLALVIIVCAVLAVANAAGLASRSKAAGGAHARATATATATPTARVTPTARATATPGLTAAQIAAATRDAQIQYTADWYLSRMSLDEKLGQMFLIETYYQYYAPDVDYMVTQLHAGALIIYGKNMKTPAQLHDYLAAIQQHATIPLLTTMDEEGGDVDRLGDKQFAQPLPSAEWLGGTGDPQLALQAGTRAADEMKALGFNTDLAPVVDLRLVPNPIEGPRIYGPDPATVDRYAGAYLQGLQQNGVIATLKHWPGIGSISSDPHTSLPVVNRSRADFESTDFAAFRGLLSDQPGMIMVTHVLVPSIDPNMPATLSPTFVNGILRGELGYNGVVMSDSLYMQGIAERYNLPQAAVLAVMAGDDLLEGAYDGPSMRAMLDALKAAIADGRISTVRINQSVDRILALKARFGLLPLKPLPPKPAVVGGGRLNPEMPSSGGLPPDADRPRLVPGS